MKIYNSKKLKTLQKEFNETFPYLRIEFFKKPHEYGESTEETERLDTNLTVGEVRELETMGKVALDGKVA